MNIYDIAREAGVSIATISRVFNGKSVVSAKTREKVEAILKKYNYTPDVAARGLVTKTTMTIAVIAGSITGEYTARLINEIESGLSLAGYRILLYLQKNQSIDNLVKAALRQRSDAIVFIGSENESDNTVPLLTEALGDIPFVAVNSFINTEKIHHISCDLVYGMMLAVSHLAGNGRREIIFVQGGGFCGDKMLEEGFAGGLAMYDLSVSSQPVASAPGFEGGFACAQALLEEKLPFNGVVCDDDSVAAGFIKCLEHHSIEVPHEVSVVGFHDTSAALCCSHSITTVDCQTETTGKNTVELLKQLLAGETPKKQEVLVPHLIIRESSI